MKNLLFIILILLLTSCNKSDNNTIVGTYIDSSMRISFVDVNGMDLLDPANTNSFNIDDIKLYHEVNGVKTLYFGGALSDHPTGIVFSSSWTYNSIGIYLADTSYLQLNSQITDTIYSEIEYANGNVKVKKIWYNGEFIWDLEDGTEHYFIFEK